MAITNLARLKMDIAGITVTDADLIIYLSENGLVATTMYDTTSKANLKAIYSTALNILEGLANNPTMMKSIKVDDMTVSEFHENLMKRIDQLDTKINNIKLNDDSEQGSSTNNKAFLFYN